MSTMKIPADLDGVDPTGDRMLIMRDEAATHAGQIELPKEAITSPKTGTIVKLGPELEDELWEAGDRVYLADFGAVEITIGDQAYVLCSPREIYLRLPPVD